MAGNHAERAEPQPKCFVYQELTPTKNRSEDVNLDRSAIKHVGNNRSQILWSDLKNPL